MEWEGRVGKGEEERGEKEERGKGREGKNGRGLHHGFRGMDAPAFIRPSALRAGNSLCAIHRHIQEFFLKGGGGTPDP